MGKTNYIYIDEYIVTETMHIRDDGIFYLLGDKIKYMEPQF